MQNFYVWMVKAVWRTSFWISCWGVHYFLLSFFFPLVLCFRVFVVYFCVQVLPLKTLNYYILSLPIRKVNAALRWWIKWLYLGLWTDMFINPKTSVGVLSKQMHRKYTWVVCSQRPLVMYTIKNYLFILQSVLYKCILGVSPDVNISIGCLPWTYNWELCNHRSELVLGAKLLISQGTWICYSLRHYFPHIHILFVSTVYMFILFLSSFFFFRNKTKIGVCNPSTSGVDKECKTTEKERTELKNTYATYP